MRSTYLPAVTAAKYVSDYLVDVTFDDGEKKRIDISQWFKGPIFDPLKNKAYFRKFFIDATALAWPNGADISPEALYDAEDVSERYNKRIIRTRNRRAS